MIIVVIVTIMLVANIAPYDRQCAWAFPKIVSCLLSARETLVAGLSAAGGALFAAWAAWSAVRDQIEFEVARDTAARQEAARSRVERAKAELSGMKLWVEHIDTILRGFKGVDASSEWNYVDDLRQFARKGGLSFFSQPLPMLTAGKAGHLMNKLNQHSEQLKQVDLDPSLRMRDTPGAITPQLRERYIALDRAIKEALDDLVLLRAELESGIAEREQLVRGSGPVRPSASG